MKGTGTQKALKPTQSQRKAIDDINQILNKIAEAAYVLTWIGEAISKGQEHEGALIRQTAKAIAERCDEAVERVHVLGRSL